MVALTQKGQACLWTDNRYRTNVRLSKNKTTKLMKIVNNELLAKGVRQKVDRNRRLSCIYEVIWPVE